jgi:ATP-binding cassette, subfamily C, bacterial exporter for protease/lipase
MTDLFLRTRSAEGSGQDRPQDPSTPALRKWLLRFRGEAWAVGAFSGVANLMMLVPTLYMLQVYDRVLLSGSELTLLAVSVFALCMYGVMAFAE